MYNLVCKFSNCGKYLTKLVGDIAYGELYNWVPCHTSKFANHARTRQRRTPGGHHNGTKRDTERVGGPNVHLSNYVHFLHLAVLEI